MFYKYPRTRHLQGSRLQPGDEDLDQVPFKSLRDAYLVVEEKLDGANCAISFSPEQELLLQSRGHYLSGGPRERQFDLLKGWTQCHAAVLWELLGPHLIMYGEWMYAKHTVYYDCLPHYFMEFDIFDTRDQVFLDTESRHALLEGSPVVSVPVLKRGLGRELPKPEKLVGPSLYKSENWRGDLTDPLVKDQTDDSDCSEGLYIKVEAEGRVVDRLKWVRPGFHQSLIESGSHWADRPIFPNRLAQGVDLYAG